MLSQLEFLSYLDQLHKEPEEPEHPYYYRLWLNNLYYTEYTKMTDLSAFDPNSFLDASTEQASEARPLIPVKRELIGEIGEPKSSKWVKKDDPSKQGIRADLPIIFTVAEMPPDIQELYKNKETGQFNIEKIVVTDGLMLDLTDTNPPAIDYAPGKNQRLRKYREATGLNVGGQMFNIRALHGRRAKFTIRHDPYEGNLYEKIDGILKI